jgi:hypothetical protein
LPSFRGADLRSSFFPSAFPSALTVVCALFFGGTAYATPLFTNFNGSIPNFVIWADDPFSHQSGAAPFTLGANDTVNQVQVKVENAQIALDTGNFDIFLYSDLAGAPGSSLETLGTDLTAPLSLGIVAVTGFSPVALTSGTQYWLVVTGAAGSHNFGYWAGGGTPTVVGELSPTANGAGSWFVPTTSVSPQFEIDGTATSATAVPEPSTLFLLGSALTALALLRNRPHRV